MFIDDFKIHPHKNKIYIYIRRIASAICVVYAICFAAISSYAYPLRGRINKTGINVRVDSTTYALSIGKMRRGEAVEIVDKKFSWYKVILPPRFICYIYSNYLNKIGANSVKIKANIINLRSKPSLASPIIGKAKRGVIFPIANSGYRIEPNRIKENSWVKVRGFPYIYGWIHSKFVDVIAIGNNNKYNTRISSKKKNKDRKIKASFRKIKVLSKPIENKDNPITIEGLLYKLRPLKDCPANYKLRNGIALYFLRITGVNNINDFAGKKVIVRGKRMHEECSYIYVSTISLSK